MEGRTEKEGKAGSRDGDQKGEEEGDAVQMKG